jgi:hypothetical protein
VLRCEISTGVGGFCLRSVRAGGVVLRDRRRGGAAVRDRHQGWLLFEIGVGSCYVRSARGGGGEWCYVRKREREQERGGERLQHFGKWFTKKKFVNHFPKFCTTFSGQ